MAGNRAPIIGGPAIAPSPCSGRGKQKGEGATSVSRDLAPGREPYGLHRLAVQLRAEDDGTAGPRDPCLDGGDVEDGVTEGVHVVEADCRDDGEELPRGREDVGRVCLAAEPRLHHRDIHRFLLEQLERQRSECLKVGKCAPFPLHSLSDNTAVLLFQFFKLLRRDMLSFSSAPYALGLVDHVGAGVCSNLISSSPQHV